MTSASPVREQAERAVQPTLIDWPRQADQRADLAVAGTACLLVVAPGAPIPLLADGEDWIYRTADERDVAARLDGLRRHGRRPGPAVAVAVPSGLDEDEHRVASRLLASVGTLVPRADLPIDDLDRTVDRLRATLRSDGWTIQRVGRAGFVLERHPGAVR